MIPRKAGPRARPSFAELLLLIHEVVDIHDVEELAVFFDELDVKRVVDVLLQAVVVVEEHQQTELVVGLGELGGRFLGRSADPELADCADFLQQF